MEFIKFCLFNSVLWAIGGFLMGAFIWILNH